MGTAQTRTLARRLAFAVGVCLFGLLGLPLVFGGLPDPTEAIVWLGLAVADGVCLVPAVVMLAGPLAMLLQQLPGHNIAAYSGRRPTIVAARLSVAIVYLVILQAIMRHPLVAVFGSSVEPFAIEATVATAIMVVLVVLLAWMHTAAAPLIEGMAQATLDAAFASSVASEAPQPRSTAVGSDDQGRTVSRSEAEAATVASGEHA